jgi:hypothetical protein
MNEDLVNNSLIYDELGLSPVWLTLSEKKEVKESFISDNLHVFYLKRIQLNSHNVLFIAPGFNLSDTSEFNLFKKISTYLDTLSDKSNQLNKPKKVNQSELKKEIISSDSLILLEQGIDKPIDKKELIVPYIISISLKEMIENPEKKRKLWQDIKELLQSIK